MAAEKDTQSIDIDAIFKAKNPGLYRLLPGFVLSYIKRVIHQTEINRILGTAKGVHGIDFADLVIREMGIHIRCKGLENIPKTGGIIIAGNHPLGGIDGTALISQVGQVRRDLRFIVNDLLMNLSNFGEVFVPVNKLGTNAKSNLEKIEQIYASDMAVMIFPAGLCSRKIDGKIQDLEWQKSFVTKAKKYQHPIVPVFVSARNSEWFYNLSRFRTKLGIKANIEMFYLADEMFKQKGKTIEFTFGKPIAPQLLDESLNIKQWSEKIRHYLYSLEATPDLTFENFLSQNKEASTQN